MEPKEHELYQACNQGDHLKVKELLSTLPTLDINWRNRQDKESSPLYISCRNGFLEIAELLLKHPRISVNQLNSYGITPFYVACANGKLPLVLLLLGDERVDVNFPDKCGSPPLFVACLLGNLPLVEALITDPRVDVNLPNHLGASPFLIACRKGHLPLVELLLADPRVEVGRPRKDRASPFFMACQNGHLEVVQLLAQDQRISINQPDSRGFPPFAVGNPQVARFLIQDPRLEVRRVDGEGEDLLWKVVRRRSLRGVELLLSRREEWDLSLLSSSASGLSLLQFALKEGLLEISHLLLLYLADHRGTRLLLRKSLGFSDQIDSDAAEIFALMIFYNENLLVLDSLPA